MYSGVLLLALFSKSRGEPYDQSGGPLGNAGIVCIDYNCLLLLSSQHVQEWKCLAVLYG